MVDASEYSFNIMNILIGDYSLLMYVEILLRVVIIMTYTIVIISWIGKRAVGGLGSADVLLVIAMGSSVGDAMLYPTIPLFLAIVVITAIALLQKLYVYISIKSETIRIATHKTVVKLVENGKLLHKNFAKNQIDRNEVFMLLRESGIEFLSEVEHAYYEQSGKLSVYKFQNPKYENSIRPEEISKLSVHN